MLVRKWLIFLMIRPVLVKVDQFSAEQAARQAGAVLHSAASNFTSSAAAGEGRRLHYCSA
jgi:hypothetical protein